MNTNPSMWNVLTYWQPDLKAESSESNRSCEGNKYICKQGLADVSYCAKSIYNSTTIEDGRLLEIVQRRSLGWCKTDIIMPYRECRISHQSWGRPWGMWKHNFRALIKVLIIRNQSRLECDTCRKQTSTSRSLTDTNYILIILFHFILISRNILGIKWRH